MHLSIQSFTCCFCIVTFQLLKAWGAHVTTTCRTDAVDLVTSLGADHVIDYHMTDVEAELEDLEG